MLLIWPLPAGQFHSLGRNCFFLPTCRKMPTQFPLYRRRITFTGDGTHTESLFAFWAQWHQHLWNPTEATTSQCAQIRNQASNQHKKHIPNACEIMYNSSAESELKLCTYWWQCHAKPTPKMLCKIVYAALILVLNTHPSKYSQFCLPVSM